MNDSSSSQHLYKAPFHSPNASMLTPQTPFYAPTHPSHAKIRSIDPQTSSPPPTPRRPTLRLPPLPRHSPLPLPPPPFLLLLHPLPIPNPHLQISPSRPIQHRSLSSPALIRQLHALFQLDLTRDVCLLFAERWGVEACVPEPLVPHCCRMGG